MLHISKIIDAEFKEGIEEAFAAKLAEGALNREVFALGMVVRTEREEDDRWIGEVEGLPGALAYGSSEMAACDAAKVLALKILADRIKHGEELPPEFDLSVYAS